MKKVLFHLSIFLLTFTFGTFSTNFSLNEKLEKAQSSQVAVENFQTIKIETEQQNEDDEYFNGWYELKNHNYGEMYEVKMISLRTDDSDKNGKYKLYGSVNTTITSFDSNRAKIVGNKVSFKTYKLFYGVEYQFNGTFFKNKTSGEDGEEILRGTLQKFIKGKKVAEVTGNFAYRKLSGMICIYDPSDYNASK